MSDTGMVSLSVDQLRHGILESDGNKILRTMSEDITVRDSLLQLAERDQLVDSLLSFGSNRQTAIPKHSLSRFGDFWDFAIEDIAMSFAGDSCVVNCRLRLYAEPSGGGEYRSADETLVYQKIGNCWRLKSTRNLFDFLMDGDSR